MATKPRLKRGDLKPGERRKVDRNIYARGRADGEIGYEIRYWYRGREIWEAAGDTITIARDALASRRGEIVKGKFQIPDRVHAPTLNAFALDYLKWAQTNKKSWELDQHLLKPLLRAFGDKRLSSITAWQIEKYKTARTAAVSPRTVNMELALLRHMFGLALSWKRVQWSPMLEVKRLREVEKPIRALSKAEEKRLLDASPPHLRDLIILALNTGLRLGELRTLAKEAVNLDVGALTVSQSKTGKVRHVPLNDQARDVIERSIAAGAPTILHYNKAPIVNIHRTWYRAIKKANLPGLRIHDLRHTFATRLVLMGVDLPTVASLLGHSSIQMTMRYSHPGPDDRRRAVAKLNP